MAIPKTLKPISQKKAIALIEKHLKAGTGDWESTPMYSDFIYGKDERYTLLRPPTYGGDWETGRVSL
jgi:hypothetical protein